MATNVQAVHHGNSWPAGTATARPAPTTAFADVLDQAREVRFSNHAQKRLASRNIQLGTAEHANLAEAVDRAAQRGGTESLVLMDELAFIVNVRDRLVITALDEQSRKEGVFTQIDSVVLAYKK
jgi:flagellar operon protein